jgi:hypothetical protein
MPAPLARRFVEIVALTLLIVAKWTSRSEACTG